MAKIGCNHHCGILVACILLWALPGCSRSWVYDQPIHTISLPSTTNPIDLQVKLVITEEYRNAKYQHDIFIIPIGENLVHHTVELMKNVFTHPMFKEDPIDPPREPAQYVMTPMLVQFDRAWGRHSLEEVKTSISVEWKLTNSAKDLIWIETVQGRAFNIPDADRDEHRRTHIKTALQDLFQKSQEVMLSSEFLRKLQFAQIK